MYLTHTRDVYVGTIWRVQCNERRPHAPTQPGYSMPMPVMMAMPSIMYPPNQMPGPSPPNTCDQSMYSFMTYDTARTQFNQYPGNAQQQPMGMPMMLIPVQMAPNPDAPQPQQPQVMYMLAPMMPASMPPAPLEQIPETVQDPSSHPGDTGSIDTKGRRSPSRLSLSRKLSIKNLLSRKPSIKSHGTPG